MLFGRASKEELRKSTNCLGRLENATSHANAHVVNEQDWKVHAHVTDEQGLGGKRAVRREHVVEEHVDTSNADWTRPRVVNDMRICTNSLLSTAHDFA